MTKTKKQLELEQQVGELTQDLQRMRADFENYRKRVDTEKQNEREIGKTQGVLKLLPIIDTIELAISHAPEDLAENKWAIGVMSISKNLQKMLDELGLKKIEIIPGEATFNPDFHEAISMEEGEGDKEIVSEELRSGYLLNGQVVRHAMVRVSK